MAGFGSLALPFGSAERQRSLFVRLWRRLASAWRRLPPASLPDWAESPAFNADPDFESLFANMVDGAFRTTPDGRVITANPALARMLGYELEELRSVNIVSQLYVNSADRDAVIRHLAAAGEVRNAELQLRRKDGKPITVLENSRAVRDEAGDILYYEGILTDITGRKEAQELFRTVSDHAPMAIFIIQDGLVQFANPHFFRLTGYPEAAVVGHDSLWMIAEEDRHDVQAAAVAMLRGARQQPYEFRISTRDRGPRWVMGNVTPIEYCGRRAILGTFVDIDDRKRFEQQLTRQAFFDSLTGLPNRNLFMDRLEHGLDNAARRGELLSVMFLDLDGFKAVNDRFGHAAGDELLCAVATRLQSIIRAGDTIARFGGDEFTLLLESVAGEQEAVIVARRMVEGFREPFVVAGEQVQLSASIGVAFGHRAGPEPGELLRRADIALYAAKAGGKQCVMIFKEGMRLEAA